MAQNLYPEDDGNERGRLLENMMDVQNDLFEGMLFHFQLPVLRSLQLSPRTVYVLRKRTPRRASQGPNQRFN